MISKISSVINLAYSGQQLFSYMMDVPLSLMPLNQIPVLWMPFSGILSCYMAIKPNAININAITLFSKCVLLNTVMLYAI